MEAKGFLADSVNKYSFRVCQAQNSNVEEQLPFILKVDIRGSKLLTSL